MTSNVIPFPQRRPVDARMWLPDDIPADTPPTPTEVAQAGMYFRGYLTAAQLVYVCGSQVRAGRALNLWLEQNGGGG